MKKKTAASNPYAIGKGGKSPADNMPPAGKYKTTMNEYDHKRPMRPVRTRMSK